MLLLVFSLSGVAWGEVLQDPTRPPFEAREGAAREGAGSVVTRTSTATKKGLLSVIISPHHCAAIIDGKTIRLGEKYGNATLIEISAQGVVLQGSGGRRSMELFPKVEMKVTASEPSQRSIICSMENDNFEIQKSGNRLPDQFGQKEKK